MASGRSSRQRGIRGAPGASPAPPQLPRPNALAPELFVATTPQCVPAGNWAPEQFVDHAPTSS
eukprot:2968690-Alexandrium_andersonii.AAC.1